MPMIMISGLGSFLGPETALAGLNLPTLVSNFWPALRQGRIAAIASTRAHWRFLAALLIAIAVSSQFARQLPPNSFFLMLGIPVTGFACFQLAGWRPRFVRFRRVAELGLGMFAGAVGGISGIWGPPTVVYLTARETPKQEHVRVQGVVYAAGAVMLALAHLHSGILNAGSARFSFVLVIPALAGLVLGFAIQDRLDQTRFRRAMLMVLAVAGLNFIRRAFVI